jgi:hypothetical protein
MPICPKCRTGYEDTEEFCPKCSSRKPVSVPPAAVFDKMRPRHEPQYICGKFGFFCLRALQFIAYVSAVSSVLFGAFMLYRGYFFSGFLSLGISAPANYGLGIAFSLAIHYARENDLVRGLD